MTDGTEEWLDDGWASRAALVDGRWVDRTPRRPDHDQPLRREVVLLPWLAERVPLPVPRPRVVVETPLTVRHAVLRGRPCPGTSAKHGAALGAFLRALHDLDPRALPPRSALGSGEAHLARSTVLGRLRAEVLPLVPRPHAPGAAALLDRVSTLPPTPCLVHGDLGPAHVRVEDEQVTGVIDWGDAEVGDPALDLAWPVFGTSAAFSDAVRSSYRPSPDLLARGRDLHLLGPWHEVLHGLDRDEEEFVTSGLAGVVGRLTPDAG